MNITKDMQDTTFNPGSKSISCVIPLYNDERTVRPTVNSLVNVLEKLNVDYEIILVDDGSPDNAGEIAEMLAGSNKKVKVIHHKNNLGYGRALRDGFNIATKKFIFFTDGDGQYDMEDLYKAWPKLDKYRAVIGYPERRADGLRRIFVSKVYNAVCRIYLGSSVRSINCSFKIIAREFFQDNKLYSKGGFIDAEIVSKLLKSGYEITQVPVSHCKRTYGRSNFLKVNYILDILSEMRKFGKK